MSTASHDTADTPQDARELSLRAQIAWYALVVITVLCGTGIIGYAISLHV